MGIYKVIITLSNRIRNLRNSIGWSQERLAREINVDPSYISKIESCNKIPTLHIISNLADAFHIDAHELLVDMEKTGKTAYKKLKIINIVKDSNPSALNVYSTLINALNQEYKKIRK